MSGAQIAEKISISRLTLRSYLSKQRSVLYSCVWTLTAVVIITAIVKTFNIISVDERTLAQEPCSLLQLVELSNMSDARDLEIMSSVVLGRGSEVDPCKVGCVGHPNARVVRVVHISDTHEEHGDLDIPPGDILIHSGDFMSYRCLGGSGFLDAMVELDNFFLHQPHKHKIFVAGNHDMCLAGQPVERIRARLPNAIYLQDNAVLVEGLKIYGSPWTGKRKSPANAFICPYPELGKYWVLIPKDTDILVTHSPPHRIMDNHGGMGCPLLRELVLKQIRPLVHMYGHAHQGPAVAEKQGVLFSNAAQYGRDSARPLVIDVYVSASVPARTKTYRPAVWREDGDPQATPSCVIV